MTTKKSKTSLREPEYGKLHEVYYSRGRIVAANPRMMFKVLIHEYLYGICSRRKLEEACQYRIDFRWLLENRKAPNHSTLAWFYIEALFYQFVWKPEKMGEADHKSVLLDGRKLESSAGEYHFVCRKSAKKQLGQVTDYPSNFTVPCGRRKIP